MFNNMKIIYIKNYNKYIIDYIIILLSQKKIKNYVQNPNFF